jgi:hypothetical protein
MTLFTISMGVPDLEAYVAACLSCFSALWVFERELLILYVSCPELEHLTDTQPSSCHELYHQPISRLRDLEDHLIHRFLVQGVPTGTLGSPEKLL